MSERFERLFSLKENQYLSGCPVIIAAGALLRDRQNDKILVQLKLRNVQAQKIKALTVRIAAYDPAGRILGKPLAYQYLDLSAARGEDFGQKTPVYLPDASARSFSVAVSEAVFDSNKIWSGPEKQNWRFLSAKQPLSKAFGDPELAKQYQLDVSAKAEYALQEFDGIWSCTCGALNQSAEAICHSCGCRLDTLRTVDLKALRNHCSERLAQEAAEREKKAAEAAEAARIAAEQQAAAAKEAQQRARRIRKIAAICAGIAAVIAAAAVLTVQVIIPAARYHAAVDLMEAGEYTEAIAAFEALDSFKDSDEQITACQMGIRDNQYAEAIAMENTGSYEEAITEFQTLDGYKDSEDQIVICQYAIALSLEQTENYEEAITGFMALNGYKDSADHILSCQYSQALLLEKNGSYEDAIAIFEALDGYEDSENQILSCKTSIMKGTEVGETVTFGAYEQDNDISNGKEAIEWIVLDRDGSDILVVSKYALDCQPYNTLDASVTWETCSLRTWLNGTFMSEAFSSAEMAKIDMLAVMADKNTEYRTSAGNDTRDQVFLLSIAEVEQYFSSKMLRQCYPTAYAEAQHASTSSGNYCWWWLRSPGEAQTDAANVSLGGSISYDGHSVNTVGGCVRPAMWINLG